MSDVSFHDLSSATSEQRANLLKRAEADLSVFVEKVRPIIEAVRTEGDAALLRFARDLDKADVADDRCFNIDDGGALIGVVDHNAPKSGW